MADDTRLNTGTGGDLIASDELTTINGAAAPAGLKVQRVKVGHGEDGNFLDANATNPLPVSGPLTDTQLRAGAVAVSAASLPLPAGAATEATVVGVRTDLGTDGTTPPAVLGAGTGVRGWLRSIYEKLTGTLAVTGTFWQTTQPVSGPVTDAQLRATAVPVSAASLPLPTGASTETTLAALNAKVTAVNTGAVVLAAGAAVVGSISNTAFTANAGTNLNTSALALDATLTGGTQKAINRSGAKGTAVAADVTSNPVDANTEALHVNLAGVNAVNATLTAETTKVIGTVNIAGAQTVGLVAGTANIGDVDVLTLPALVAGTAIIGALVANQSVNEVQIGGVAIAVGSGVSGTGVQRVVLATDVIQPAVSESRAATLHVSVTAAVNTALTASLPAPAAGLYHYITHVELVKLYAVLGVAAAAGVVVTTTNLHSIAWTTEQAAGPLGTAPKAILYSPTTPLKCAVAATATTFVVAAQTQTIWRWNISYFTAA